jgi:hypothetical protein
MSLKELTLANGKIAVVKGYRYGGRREAPDRCACGGPARYLCDFPLVKAGVKITHCDRPLCAACIRVQALRKDDRQPVEYCAEHDEAARARAAAATAAAPALAADENRAWGLSDQPAAPRARPRRPR